MNVEIIFAEFGGRGAANQKWESDIGRLDPTYSSVKEYFPEAKIICYSDDKSIGDNYDVEVRFIDSDSTPFDKDYKDFPCRCGAKKCVGFIVNSQSRWRIKKLRKRKSTSK